jgi:hypothetical protein
MPSDTSNAGSIDRVFGEVDQQFDAVRSNPTTAMAWRDEVTRSEFAALWYELGCLYRDRGWDQRARRAMCEAQHFGAAGAATALAKMEVAAGQEGPRRKRGRAGARDAPADVESSGRPGGSLVAALVTVGLAITGILQVADIVTVLQVVAATTTFGLLALNAAKSWANAGK